MAVSALSRHKTILLIITALVLALLWTVRDRIPGLNYHAPPDAVSQSIARPWRTIMDHDAADQACRVTYDRPDPYENRSGLIEED